MSTTTNNGTGNDCPCVTGKRPDVEAYLWGLVCPDCGARLLPCYNPRVGERGQGWAHCLGDDSSTPARRGCGWHGPRSRARQRRRARHVHLTSPPQPRHHEWAQEMQASFADRSTLRDQALRTIHHAARLPLRDSDGALASEVLWLGSQVDGLKSELEQLRDVYTALLGLDNDALAVLVNELRRRGVLPPRKPEPEPEPVKLCIDCPWSTFDPEPRCLDQGRELPGELCAVPAWCELRKRPRLVEFNGPPPVQRRARITIDEPREIDRLNTRGNGAVTVDVHLPPVVEPVRIDTTIPTPTEGDCQSPAVVRCRVCGGRYFRDGEHDCDQHLRDEARRRGDL